MGVAEEREGQEQGEQHSKEQPRPSHINIIVRNGGPTYAGLPLDGKFVGFSLRILH
jgi:hypothetical protein